jgi:hypothetical protein
VTACTSGKKALIRAAVSRLGAITRAAPRSKPPNASRHSGMDIDHCAGPASRHWRQSGAPPQKAAASVEHVVIGAGGEVVVNGDVMRRAQPRGESQDFARIAVHMVVVHAIDGERGERRLEPVPFAFRIEEKAKGFPGSRPRQRDKAIGPRPKNQDFGMRLQRPGRAP